MRALLLLISLHSFSQVASFVPSEISILLPSDIAQSLQSLDRRQLHVAVNRVPCSSTRYVTLNDIRITLQFSQSDCDLMLQPAPDPSFIGGWYNTSFTLPSAFIKQLANRQQTYPINWTVRDEVAPWLAPSRLLLHPYLGSPSASSPPRMFIDGSEVPLVAAFNSRGGSNRPASLCSTTYANSS